MLLEKKNAQFHHFSFACISTILIVMIAFAASKTSNRIVNAGNQANYTLSCNVANNRIGGSYDSITTAVTTTSGNNVYLSTKGLYVPYDVNSSIGQFRLSKDFCGSGLIYNSSPIQNLSVLKLCYHLLHSYANTITATIYLSETVLSNPTGVGESLVSDVEFPIVGDYQYFAIKVSSDFSLDQYENIVVMIDSLDLDYECGSSYIDDTFDYVFKNGETTIASGTLLAGQEIPLPSSVPSKNDDADYTYSFEGYEGYVGGMRIYDDMEFTANFTALAKDPYALMNSNNTLDINIGPRDKDTAASDEFVFEHNLGVSTIATTSQYVSSNVTEFEGSIGEIITLPSYSRTINMMITGAGSSSEENTTYFGGLYLYAGFEREISGYSDPIGLAKTAAKKSVKIWSSIYNIENLIFRDIVFHTRGAMFQFGLSNDYLNDPTSNIGNIQNIVFENCTFEDITSCNDQVMYVNNGNKAFHTNAGGCVNFANTRNTGNIEILATTMNNLLLADGSAITTRGLHDLTMCNNTITNINYGAWLHSGYGITGSAILNNNTISNTGNRMLRVNTKQGHNLFENGNDDGTMCISNNVFNHSAISTSFMKFDNENTTSTIYPYQYEETGRLQLDSSNDFYFNSLTALTGEQLAAGSKNCGLHSGDGEATYIDGLYFSVV